MQGSFPLLGAVFLGLGVVILVLGGDRGVALGLLLAGVVFVGAALANGWRPHRPNEGSSMAVRRPWWRFW